MKHLGKGLLLLALVGTLAACQQPGKSGASSSTASSEQVTKKAVSIVIKTSEKTLKEKKVTLKKGDTVDLVLKKVAKVTEDKSGFIESIDGKKNNENNNNEWWTYTVNGKEAQVGANQYKLKANDKIVFQLTKYDK